MTEVLYFPSADHFPDDVSRRRAARIGMWIFLATEVLLFAGLFTIYAGYRVVFPEGFHHASREMDVVAGTVNTIVLITASFLVALALDRGRAGRHRATARLLFASVGLGLLFLVIKAFEYAHHAQHGALPGPFFRGAESAPPGVAMFFALYFVSTGLHALHVTVGLGVLTVLGVRSLRRTVNRAYDTPLELGGMYWHLVDVIWIFLYPLLYLIR